MRAFAVALALCAAPAYAQNVGPKNQCVELGTLVDGLDMQSSRSFSVNRDNFAGGFDLLTVWVQLTDANSSITRFDVTCTVSDDGNSTDYEPQECTSASGTYTCVDSGVWQKASPGTSKFPLRLDVSGFPDFECTFSVGTGAGAAADLLTVKGRLCTGG
jgi:hypothetical protein